MRNPFRSWSRRKTYTAAAGAAAGVVVFGAAFTLAAGITVTTTNVVAGSADVVNCDADGFSAALGDPSWDAGTGAYVVSDVIVTGLDTTAAGCAGQTLLVDLVDGSNNSLTQVSYSIVEGNSEFTLTLDSPVNAESVTKVAAAVFEQGA